MRTWRQVREGPHKSISSFPRKRESSFFRSVDPRLRGGDGLGVLQRFLRSISAPASLFAAALTLCLISTPLEAASLLQCVPYARDITNVPLQGDAWTWWGKAARSRLDRGREPEAGSILVFRRTERLRRGHVAVVAEVVNRREIVVDHANWASRRAMRGRVDLAVRVVDVSPANDWSAVRVWHAASDSLGRRVYPTYGFIYAFAIPGTAS